MMRPRHRGRHGLGGIAAACAVAAALSVSSAGATERANATGAVAWDRAPTAPFLLAQDDDLLLDDDDLLLDDDDLLLDDEFVEEEEEEAEDAVGVAEEAHEALFAEERYPSAATCVTCHPKHYREWSVSQHSYAQLSPLYLSLNNRINELANGSNGDFCLRCHNQVGANLGENSFISNLERHPTSREGITCVVCHRISKDYNKASGRLALEEGDLLSPIYGPTGNAELARVLDNRDVFRFVTDPDEPGRKIHRGQTVRLDLQSDLLRHLP